MEEGRGERRNMPGGPVGADGRVEEAGQDGTISDESLKTTSCINGRVFTFDNTKNSKCILYSYCLAFWLPKPEFEIHEEYNPARHDYLASSLPVQKMIRLDKQTT